MRESGTRGGGLAGDGEGAQVCPWSWAVEGVLGSVGLLLREGEGPDGG